MILKRRWQVVWVVLSVSCAGDLSDPGRFAFLYSDAGPSSSGESGGGNGGSGGSAGKSGSNAGGSGGGGGSAMMATPDPAPACAVSLFKMKCGASGCHAAGGTQVDLVSANVERRLVDKGATGTACKGKTLIAGDGGDSLLIDKLSDSPPCGSPMPITGSLTDDDRTCLMNWVSSVSDSN
jgi:hypothetical protein